MKQVPHLYRLDDFGLKLSDLRRLGAREVHLHAHFRHVDESTLFRFSPSERKRRVARSYEQKAKQAELLWPVAQYTILRSSTKAYGIESSLPARLVPKLLGIAALGDIWVESVEGRRRRRQRSEPRWFTVRARFVIQVEGQRKGNQTYEDRFVAVRATSFDHAVEKLRGEFREYGRPYLNPDGYMVRWHFEEVLDVYDTGEQDLDGSCVEVFSALRTRRLRPKSRWNPRTSPN